MKQWKTRLAICLCLLLAAPTVIGALPVNKLEAEATGSDKYECLWILHRYAGRAGQDFQYGRFVSVFSVQE